MGFAIWVEKHLAWLSGLFEGEGNISYRHGLVIGISMIDYDVLEKFKFLSKMGTVRGPYKRPNPNCKPIFDFRVTGKDAYALAVAMWSYLGVRRREQVKIALQKFANYKQYNAKLSLDNVVCIRKKIASGEPNIEIAKQFGVASSVIRDIRAGRCYRSIAV